MAPNVRRLLSVSTFSNLAKTTIKPALTLAITLLPTISSVAQQPIGPPDSSAVASSNNNTAISVPAGTRIALVLTQPIQTRYVHRGDDIYAQIVSPVNVGNEVVIPPSTFVQGKVDKLERQGGQGELHLQSMSITFPDGYVAAIAGPVTLDSPDGYAVKDPGKGRIIGSFTLPAAGLGIGALIGHSVASSQPNTITNSLPPGCSGPPPGCLSSSLTVPASSAKSTAIGAILGGALGGIAALVLLANSHDFFLDVGSPVEMVLQRPMTLQQDEVANAVRQSERHPVPEQPVAPRPQPLPPPDSDPGFPPPLPLPPQVP